MKITNEIYEGITGLIEDSILMGVRLHAQAQFTELTAKGLAQNVAAQICQNLEVE